MPLPEDEDRVALLSYNLWKSGFGGDTAVIEAPEVEAPEPVPSATPTQTTRASVPVGRWRKRSRRDDGWCS